MLARALYGDGESWKLSGNGVRGAAVMVRHKLFESSFKSWQSMCDEAAAFASTLGRDRLINISVTQGDTGGKGVIFVWYWE